jgi:hypothetical protein
MASEHRRRRPTLATIPDLRFEQSYIQSIDQHVKFRRAKDGQEEVLEIGWGPLLWSTFQKQVFAPFVQGAAW